MKFRAVLFDAAETLFTTRGSVGEIYGSIAREYGSQAAPEVIQAAFVRHFRGAGPISTENQKQWWRDVVFRVFSDVGMVENFDEFFNKVYDRFRDSQGWILFPETREVLDHLKRFSIKIGVISNFDDRIYSVMRSLDILSYFDSVTISSQTGYCKPDPRIFEAAIRALGVPASDILLVGDSLRDDVEAGKRAGLTAVLMDRSGRYASIEVPRISTLKEVLSFL
ncbi:MAG TPA: HAD-IA family hydrolase [Terriglobia bacterium]|nr:HAD-IA family hydrolase [Terriglobia bacterium]